MIPSRHCYSYHYNYNHHDHHNELKSTVSKQLHKTLKVHQITKIRAKSQESGYSPVDFPQMPGYLGNPDLSGRLIHTVCV